MFTIEGIYDGNEIKPLKHIPVGGKRKVIITFLNSVEGTEDPEHVTCILEALRGCDKGANLVKGLLESRRKDMELEGRKWGE